MLAYAPINTTSGLYSEPLRQLGWKIVASDTQANALAGVTRSTKVVSLVGVLIIALVVIIATATTRVITRPIEALTETAASEFEPAWAPDNETIVYRTMSENGIWTVNINGGSAA